MSRRFGLSRWGPVSVLLVATVGLFWRYLFTWPIPLIFPESALGTDLPREVWPLARFIADSWRQQGELPLWRPYQLSGAPLIGHPVAPVLYPLNWLVLVLPLPLALNLNAVFHLWWCGVGMYGYLRQRAHLRVEAALTGALLLAHAPKWVAHYSGGHWPMMAAIAWWPWALWAFMTYWATGRARWAALLGVALAAQALNHGTYVLITCVGLGLTTLIHLRPNVVDGVKKAALGWGIASITFVGLAAGQLLPLLELLPHTTRVALSPAESAFGSLPPPLLLALFFSPELKFPEWFVFPGAGTLALALLSWVGRWSRTEQGWAWAGLAGLVLSLGGNTPVYRILYQLPGFALFRNPSRWSIVTLTALAVLAAFGIEKWLGGTSLSRPRMLLPLSTLAVAYWMVAGLKSVWPTALPFDVLFSAVAVAAVATILLYKPGRWPWFAILAVVIAELWWTAAGLIRPEPESAIMAGDPIARFLQSSAQKGERSFAPYGGISASTLVTFNLRAAEGYDPAPLAGYAELVRRAAGCAFEGYAVSAPPTLASPEATKACPQLRPERDLLALLNVRYVSLPAPADLPGAPMVLADSTRWVYDLGPGRGRVFRAAGWETVPAAGCVERLAEVDLSETALVESVLPPAAKVSHEVVILSHESNPDREIVTIRMDTPGLLIRSESWAPGWRAWVDNHPAAVHRVDCALQGVWLEAGVRRLVFEYRPAGYVAGRWISVLTLIGWMGSVLYPGAARLRQLVKRAR